jgi:hypothetical protein
MLPDISKAPSLKNKSREDTEEEEEPYDYSESEDEEMNTEREIHKMYGGKKIQT